jgi:membrane fusion protein (multidrug efflux system)
MPEDKKRLLKVFGFLGLAAVIVIGFALVRHYAKFETTDDAFIDGPIIPISPKVAGQVLALRITDNQSVKEGDVLVEIDPRDYEAQLAEQRAKAAAAEAEARRAAADAQRYEKIFKQDEISRQQLDQAQATAASSEATLEKERAALQQDELNLSYTKIQAPEAGRVTRKSVEEGAYVQVGQTLFSIVPDQVWVIANFKETQLTQVRPGQKVTLKVDTYPGHLFEGHVDSIQSGTGERFSVLPPENATGNYVKVVQRIPVKILIDTPPDADFRLAPGMSVVPTVRLQ